MLLCGSKNAFCVIPWLDHDIKKKLKKTGSRDQVAG
ncbi:permease [Rickettsia parkeri]|nr:permease [Rickettsia parkeri]